MNARVPVVVMSTVVAAVAAAPCAAQERIVTDDSPLPTRSEDAPHPDDVVSADQLTEIRRKSNTRRNVELVVGLIFVVILLAYALLRPPKTR